MNAPEYYRLSEENIEAAAHIYARAFFHDDLFVYLLPKERSREKAMLTTFRVLVSYHVKFGEIYGIGSPLQGVAAWKTPKVTTKETLRGLLQCGFGRFIFSSYAWNVLRALRLVKKTARLHKTYAYGVHFYLDMLSVDPSCHGQGLASKLVKPMLSLAKDQHLPVYLETTNFRNVTLYEHFGFTMMEMVSIQNDKMKVWALLKDA